MARQSADGHITVHRMRAGQKVAVIENVTVWAESTWAAYADHGDDTHIVTGKEKYVADTINVNDYYLWQGKATDTNNYYSVYALIWKIETTTDNKKKLYFTTKYYTIAQKGDTGNDGRSVHYNMLINSAFDTIGLITFNGGAPMMRVLGADYLDSDTAPRISGGTKTGTIRVPSTISSNIYAGYFFTAPVSAGKVYTVSVWYYVDTSLDSYDVNEEIVLPQIIYAKSIDAVYGTTGREGTAYMVDNILSMSNGNLVLNNWTQVTKTFTVPEGMSYVEANFFVQRNGCVTISEPKLEEGDAATAWAPAASETKGTQGEMGKQGLQGCIMRVSEWVAGVEYHNDEALTSGTRYLDIAVVTTGANTFKTYKCLVTHTATSDNAPVSGTTTTQWEPFNTMAPVYTPLLFAQYALLRLAQTNQIVVTDNNNNLVGGVQGDISKPIFWIQDPKTLSAIEMGFNSEGVATMNIYGTQHRKGISLEMDANGLPHLKFYDQSETAMYDLGYTGLKQLVTSTEDAKWTQIKLYSVENYPASKTYILYSATQNASSGVTVYKYSASYNPTTQTYGTDGAYNDIVYCSNAGGLVEDAAISYLSNSDNYYADGYYVVPGGWETWLNNNQSSHVYKIIVYTITKGNMGTMGVIYSDGKHLTDSQGNNIETDNEYVYSSLIEK